MTNFLDHLSANDNDIYDLLISGKQKLTAAVLREMAKDRGIFYSPEDSREELADKISLLPHDYYDIEGIAQRREPAQRREKTTFVRLDSILSVDEMKHAAALYSAGAGVNEDVAHRVKGSSGYSVNVTYDEFNHTKARLLQRERHEAEIDFSVEGGQTVIRLPATDKAKKVVSAIKETIAQRRRKDIAEEMISLAGLSTPGLRSKFFTRLISTMPSYKLVNVMNLKVSLMRSTDGEGLDDVEIDLDDDVEEHAEKEMFAVVHSMALSGQNLVQSHEYRDLVDRGFYITSITWKSEYERTPNDIVQFDAGFEDKTAGTGFRYQVQGVYRAYKGGHRKTIDHKVEDLSKVKLFSLLESTARKVLEGLLLEAASAEQDESGASV